MGSRLIKKILPGDTGKMTWVNSGATLDTPYAFVENNQGTIISSETVVDSGNGHYFALHTTAVGSDGFYVMELGGDIGGYPYKRRRRFEVTVFEVD